MMRYTQAEKMEIIRLVENSDLSIRDTLKEWDVPKTSFYRWYHRYQEEGYDGLADRGHAARRFWNKIPQQVHFLTLPKHRLCCALAADSTQQHLPPI